ncbi:glycine--tRNA ligase subunit beta [Bacillus sp. AGMB 02131]|uniref:Glycine--tRNA ligase beta subunit n=1 Tax=Peribacillus faecalis TaxID=2772559 RepID=A0A927CTI4_9BACI|nr:glycine--tRNA ligase subunit beta [Peribacillus faecalis]MBD3107583.1 glycine--tRNA ligase subunit beta [Peribacillus faecalis]
MSKKDLLIEIGLEELPARFVTDAIEQLQAKVQKWFEEKKIGYADIHKYSTPRRLAIVVTDVNEMQADTKEEAKGPAKKIAQDAEGNWSKAAIGFARGQGVSVEDIYFKEIKGVEYVHVMKFTKGQQVKELIVELKDIITSLTFPKNMRWANNDMRYARPIKWMIALFGNEIIPFSITNVETSNTTMGHRFLGTKVEIAEPAQYVQKLEEQFVIADSEKRKNMILAQLKQMEQENGWVIPVDEDLLEEVNNLVEYPTALFGKFEEEYLELPDRVLITSMKEHQRYFPVKNEAGELLPFFVTVRNGSDHGIATVARGNEKVLRARLADAAFFYREDQQKEINDCLKKLETIVYHEEIGTLAEKVSRVRELTGKISEAMNINESTRRLADRTAEIAKFDLVTGMVYEFPELQGYMGERYARIKGEDEAVAVAINEHYMPRHAEDSVPSSEIGAIVSVAEKMDTIIANFAINNIPTGSQDPYALRRQASGIVQILLEKKWPVSLEAVIDLALEPIIEQGFAKREAAEIKADLISFFEARIKHHLNEQQVRYDLIDAVLTGEIGIVSSLVNRALVLEKAKGESSFKETVEALSRVMNIAVKLEDEPKVSVELFENESEKALYNEYVAMKEQYEMTSDEEKQFALLASLQGAIERFFEDTMVMADDEALRFNRLSLMKKVADVIKSFAFMNKVLVL